MAEASETADDPAADEVLESAGLLEQPAMVSSRAALQQCINGLFQNINPPRSMWMSSHSPGGIRLLDRIQSEADLRKARIENTGCDEAHPQFMCEIQRVCSCLKI